MSEVTFTVTFDNPDENLEATLLPSLMVAVLDKWGVDYHDATISGRAVWQGNVPAEFLPCLYDSDPDWYADPDCFDHIDDNPDPHPYSRYFIDN